MENPHVQSNLQQIQAALSNYDTSFLSDDEEDFCPLCIEPMDITDKNFKPCPCGYQICQFCYNNIRQNPELNGRCPACRRKYDDENVEYIVLTPEEIKFERAKQAKKERERKQREKERKESEYNNRKHLAGMRVIQKNLVYVIGLNPQVPYEEVSSLLRSDKYFGQYGKINKIVVNRKTGHNEHNGSYGIYVTFTKREDAAKCIQSVDGTYMDGRLVKAAYGTTKYCSSYLRGQPCPNPNCMFLHEPGEEADSFNKKELNSKQHIQTLGVPLFPIQTNVHNLSQGVSASSVHNPSLKYVSSPAPVRPNLNSHNEDPISATSTPTLNSSVLMPASVPTGSNPWGTITQSSTPIPVALTKTSSLTSFPTLGEAINTAISSQLTNSSTNNNSLVNTNPSKNKRNNEKRYEDPFDPLMSAVKVLDETIKTISDYHTRDYNLRTNIIDESVYLSYPPLFSFENIDIADKSAGILASKLADMLAIKPIDYQASILPFSQNGSQVSQHILHQAHHYEQQQLTPSGITPQQVHPQLYQQQHLHNMTINTPPPGMFLNMSQHPINPHITSTPVNNSNNNNNNNSTDLLNQLINGKK